MRKGLPSRSICPHRRENWVDFPDPSVPSRTMSLPAMTLPPYLLFPRAARAETRNKGSLAIRPMRLGSLVSR